MIRFGATGRPYRLVGGVRESVTLYFAYGMNLDPRYMPEGSVPLGAATLADWKFEFRAYADIQPAEGEVVRGALWQVTDVGLRILDRREGYSGTPDGLYDRREVEVECSGKRYAAIVYFMTARTLQHGLHEPTPSYLSMLEHGYDVFGIDHQLLADAVERAIAAVPEYAWS